VRKWLSLILLTLGFSGIALAQNQPFSDITLSSSGRPVGGANIAVCTNPGLTTTAATVTANVATLTMSSNPITAGFVANQAIAVSGFTGADTYFNGGSVTSTGITNNFLILAVTSTQIQYLLTHANATAITNGSVFQSGSSGQACAPLASITSDPAGLNPITQPGFTSTGLGNYQFYAPASGYYVQFYGNIIGIVLKPVGLPCAPNLACTITGAQNSSGANTFTGANTFSGNLTATSPVQIGTIRYASGFTGSDCGAKVNAADANLGATAGEIWVDQNCGTTFTTAVSLSANHVLKFVQGGTYSISAMITLTGQSSGITASATLASGTGVSGNNPVYLKETNTVNLPAVVKATGTMNFVSNVTIDGNKANNACGSPPCYGLWVFKVLRFSGQNLEVQQAPTDNIRIESSTAFGNESAAYNFQQTQSVFAGRDAVRCTDTADGNWFRLEAGESTNGLNLIDCATTRVVMSDFGNNTQNGIRQTCTTAADGGGGSSFVQNQLATNLNEQWFIDAWTGSAQCNANIGNVIVGTKFLTPSVGQGGVNNGFDGLHIQNSQTNTIVGSNFNNTNGGVTFKNCIGFAGPSVAEGVDSVVGGNCNAFGTSAVAGANGGTDVWITNANKVVGSGSLTVGGTYNVNSVSLSQYNNIATVAGGQPVEYATVDLTAQGASIGSTSAYAVPATGAGLYRISIYGVVSQAATTSSTLPTACVIWTDRDSSGAQQQIFNVTASGLTNTSNTTSTSEYGTIVVNAKLSTTINYAFGNACTGGSAYASVGATSMQYAVRVRVEAL